MSADCALTLSVSCPPPVSLHVYPETGVSYLCQERQFSAEEEEKEEKAAMSPTME